LQKKVPKTPVKKVKKSTISAASKRKVKKKLVFDSESEEESTSKKKQKSKLKRKKTIVINSDDESNNDQPVKKQGKLKQTKINYEKSKRPILPLSPRTPRSTIPHTTLKDLFGNSTSDEDNCETTITTSKKIIKCALIIL